MKQLLTKLKRRITLLLQSKKERRHALVGQAKLWELKRDFQIQFLKDMGLMPKHYLCDIGCGTLRGGLPIIKYLDDGRYFGIEVREKVLEEGRKELEEAGLEGNNPTLLLCSDMSQLTIDRKFDYIWGFSVLFHMQDKILNHTLQFVSRHLSENGVLYTNVNIGEREKDNWQGFPVVARPLDFYRKVCAMNGLVVTDIGSLKELGHLANIESQDNQRMLKITKKV